MSFDPHTKSIVPLAEGLSAITRGIAAAQAALAAGDGEHGLAIRGGELTIDFELGAIEGGEAIGMRLTGAAPGVARDAGARVKLTLALGSVNAVPMHSAVLASVDSTVSAAELNESLLRLREEQGALERSRAAAEAEHRAAQGEHAQAEHARADAVRERETAEREHHAAEAALAQAMQMRRALATAIGEAEPGPAPEEHAAPAANMQVGHELLGAVAELDRHVVRLGLRPSVADALRGQLREIGQAVTRGEFAVANDALSRFVGANEPLLRLRG